MEAVGLNPFDLLRDIERRSQESSKLSRQLAIDSQEWRGIGFSVAGRNFTTAVGHVAEIMPVPSIMPVPAAKSWLLGVTNIRGDLLPVVDLRQFLFADKTLSSSRTRLMVIKNAEYMSSLLVDEVRGMLMFDNSQHTHDSTVEGVDENTYIDGAYEKDGELWHVLNVPGLMSSAAFLDVASK